MKVLCFLKRYCPDVVFLQETHLEASDFHRMNKLWVGQVFGSPSVQGKAGVLTLLHKNFSHTSDDGGRESIVTISQGGRVTALCNMYGPNGDNAPFFQNLGVQVHEMTADAVILGRDLNTVLSPREDRKSSKAPRHAPPDRRSDMVLPPFLEVTGLRDVWRDCNPEGRDFTHFSHAHQSWSRLDYILTSKFLSPRVLSIDIGPLIISDHAPVILQLADVQPKGGDFVWRFPAHMVRDDSFKELLQGWWLEYSYANESHRSDPALFWNAAKAVMRGRIMSYVSTYKMKTKQAYEAASTNLREAYTLFKDSPSPQNRERWLQSKQEFELWVERKESF